MQSRTELSAQTIVERFLENGLSFRTPEVFQMLLLFHTTYDHGEQGPVESG